MNHNYAIITDQQTITLHNGWNVKLLLISYGIIAANLPRMETYNNLLHAS